MSRRISVELIGDSASLERAFKRSERSAHGFSIGLGTLVKSAAVLGGVAAAAEGIGKAFHAGIGEFTESTKLAAQTAAAIKSTGGAAGVTAKQIDGLALRLSNLSGIDDEVVKAGENVLLSFTQIRDHVGKGNDVFTRATKAVVDYAARTGKDVPQAAIILGRALADPASRLASLSRAGIVFTRQQIEQVKAIEKTRGVLAAQKVVLEELTKRFGGAAKAAGSTLPGQLNVLRDRFKDLAGSIVGVLAPSFGKAISGLTGFVRRLSVAPSVHAKLEVVWEGVEAAVRGLARMFESVGWAGIVRTLASGAENALRRVDFRAAGRAAGAKVGEALRAIGDAIGSVRWSQVGAAIVHGFGAAVKFAAAYLPPVLAGLGRLAVKLLLGIGELLAGAGRALGSALLHGLEAGLRAAGRALERLAIGLVLKIIEPFSHLPKFLGGGPFQDLKSSLQAQLDGMVTASQAAAGAIKDALAGVTAVLPSGADRHGPAASRASSASAQAPKVSPTVTAAATAAAAAATKTVETSFTLPFRLRLAEAEAAATKAAGDDVKVARDIRAFVLRAIPRLHGEKLLGAYQELGQINQTLAGAVQAAADKVKGFTVPLALQVAQARATALGKDDALRAILTKIRQAAERALKSGKLGLQGQLDAWNTIAGINDQLKNAATGATSAFRKANTAKLAEGLGLSADQVKALRARLSQLGPGGTVPARGVGAFGVVQLAGSGAPIVVEHQTVLDGNVIERSVTRYQQKRARRNPSQRRGLHAGGGL